MSIIVQVQCCAMIKNKQSERRCKNKTKKGTMCWQHQRSVLGLKIKKSGIPNAGLGLFTTKFIASGSTICEYKGNIIVEKDKNYDNPYALQIKLRPPTFIDASRTDTCEARFANDGRCPDKNNASLYYNSRTKKAYLQATKEVHPGEEVFCNYGGTYWV